MKTTFLHLKHLSLLFVLMLFAFPSLAAQTPPQTQQNEAQIAADALAEIEALKEEIKVINRQIQQGLPKTQADSLKHARTLARLKAYKQKVALLELEEKEKSTSSTSKEQQYIISVPPVVSTVIDSEAYMISMGLALSFGFNTMLTAGEQLQDNRYKLFGSRFFELGWAWAKPLKREKAKLHLKYGVSLMVNGYKLTDSQYLTKQNEGITFQSFDSPLTKSKLTITQLVFPVHLHFGRIERTAERVGTGWPVELKIYRRKPFQSMRFGLGGYAGFNVRNVHKLKYRDEDGRRKKIKYKDHLNVNQFIVGLSGYLSLGPDFYLYSKYELTPVFRNQSPQSNHFAVGLRMNFD